jgi:hypothetical protein
MNSFQTPRDLRSDGIAIHGTDEGLHVQFFIKPIHMEALSKDAGFPIFQDRVFTRIFAPGMTKTIWEHATRGVNYETVVDADTGEYHTSWEVSERMENGEKPEPARFPNAWNAFIKKGAKVDQGWPIEEWGAITRSFAESLKAMNVHTVESLSTLTDQAAANIMGGIKYRDLAKASLDERKKHEVVAREQARAERADERAASMEAELKALKAQIKDLEKSNGKTEPNVLRKVHKDQLKKLSEMPTEASL